MYQIITNLLLLSPAILLIRITSGSKGVDIIFSGHDNSFVLQLMGWQWQGHDDRGAEGRDIKKVLASEQFIKPGTPTVPQGCQ